MWLGARVVAALRKPLPPRPVHDLQCTTWMPEANARPTARVTCLRHCKAEAELRQHLPARPSLGTYAWQIWRRYTCSLPRFLRNSTVACSASDIFCNRSKMRP